MRSAARCTLRCSWGELSLALLLALGCTEPNPAYVKVLPPPEADAAAQLADTGPPPSDLAPPVPDQAPAPDAATPPDTAPDAGTVTPDAAVTLPPDVRPPADRGPFGSALLVVGASVNEAADGQLEASLRRLGFTVAVRDAPAAVTGDAMGRALLVISGSAYSDDVGSKFRDVAVPAVVFDDAVFGLMKMTGTKSGTDFGSVLDERRLMIVDDTHPLAGGLSGLVTIANGGLQVSWGVPSSNAIRVATVVDQPTRYTIFGYLEGSTMVGMTAPARRVGSFVRFPEETTYTESGLLLFEAAALWAIGQLD